MRSIRTTAFMGQQFHFRVTESGELDTEPSLVFFYALLTLGFGALFGVGLNAGWEYRRIRQERKLAK